MPISKPHSTIGASNKESCLNLAMYLEKENRDLDTLLIKASSKVDQRDIEKRKQFFFSHSKTNFSTNAVISSIDTNIKKLGKNDAKYFAPTISFSYAELNHILKTVNDDKEFKNIWELNQNDYQLFNTLIQDYVRLVMTNYAINFNRQKKGLNTGEDLLYFAKIEHFRKFKGTDEEVIKGHKKAGDLKEGFQTHAHVIVSRKDKTQRLKLAPTANERSTTRKIGNNSYRVGFDRIKWIEMNEASFDLFFNYNRSALEKFKNQNILKNGSPKEKKSLLESIEKCAKPNLNENREKAKVKLR